MTKLATGMLAMAGLVAILMAELHSAQAEWRSALNGTELNNGIILTNGTNTVAVPSRRSLPPLPA